MTTSSRKAIILAVTVFGYGGYISGTIPNINDTFRAEFAFGISE